MNLDPNTITLADVDALYAATRRAARKLDELSEFIVDAGIDPKGAILEIKAALAPLQIK